jgi:hypothetical protein
MPDIVNAITGHHRKTVADSDGSKIRRPEHCKISRPKDVCIAPPRPWVIPIEAAEMINRSAASQKAHKVAVKPTCEAVVS